MGPRQEGPEVGVGRDQDAFVSLCMIEYVWIQRPGKSKLPYVNDVMPSRYEQWDQLLGEVLVEKQPHALGRSGSSRSRTASAA